VLDQLQELALANHVERISRAMVDHEVELLENVQKIAFEFKPRVRPVGRARAREAHDVFFSLKLAIGVQPVLGLH
jgi:hypothetical protein